MRDKRKDYFPNCNMTLKQPPQDSVVSVQLVTPKQKPWVQIALPYLPKVIPCVRALPGVQWNAPQRVWQFPYSPEVYNAMKESLWNKVILDCQEAESQIAEWEARSQSEAAHQKEFSQLDAWMRSQRYSPQTIKTYMDSLRVLARWFSPVPLHQIHAEDLIQFNIEYILTKGYSAAYQNQMINAFKLYLKRFGRSPMKLVQIQRPRRAFRLPHVLSKQEVKRILESLINRKHRAMLSLIYACGLRRSEVLNLRPSDIQSDRGLLFVGNAKGAKDRVVPLSPKLLIQLREYYRDYRPKVFLFEGQGGGKYSPKSLQLVLRHALEKASIHKPATLHWLRHSYATHLLENGTDIRYIQELLGHSSSRTTELYTHVSNRQLQQIRSPFDDL
jgi:integrase/recombinase XerD